MTWSGDKEEKSLWHRCVCGALFLWDVMAHTVLKRSERPDFMNVDTLC